MGRKSKKKLLSEKRAAAGRKGGLKKGPTKARDSDKMREAQKKRWLKPDAPDEKTEDQQ